MFTENTSKEYIFHDDLFLNDIIEILKNSILQFLIFEIKESKMEKK
jgi:hypothetical protein